MSAINGLVWRARDAAFHLDSRVSSLFSQQRLSIDEAGLLQGRREAPYWEMRLTTLGLYDTQSINISHASFHAVLCRYHTRSFSTGEW